MGLSAPRHSGLAQEDWQAHELLPKYRTHSQWFDGERSKSESKSVWELIEDAVVNLNARRMSRHHIVWTYKRCLSVKEARVDSTLIRQRKKKHHSVDGRWQEREKVGIKRGNIGEDESVIVHSHQLH